MSTPGSLKLYQQTGQPQYQESSNQQLALSHFHLQHSVWFQLIFCKERVHDGFKTQKKQFLRDFSPRRHTFYWSTIHACSCRDTNKAKFQQYLHNYSLEKQPLFSSIPKIKQEAKLSLG